MKQRKSLTVREARNEWTELLEQEQEQELAEAAHARSHKELRRAMSIATPDRRGERRPAHAVRRRLALRDAR